MSNFHTTMSRRDFMKVLGLAGTGVGAASLVAPAFHDLDELTSSASGAMKRPWWVKELEFDKPTIDIDFSQMKRFDGRFQGQAAYTRSLYYGKDRILAASAAGAAKQAERIARNDFTLRTQALQNGMDSCARTREAGDFGWNGSLDPSPAKTPEQLGRAKWTGTPEEAALMLRSAMRVYGAAHVNYGEVTHEIREKVFFSYEKANANSSGFIDKWPPPETKSGARPIVYENVDIGYETDTKLVIPTKQMWEISVSTFGSNELWRRAPNFGNIANRATFLHVGNINACTQNFLRTLGYQKLGVIGNAKPYNDATHFGSDGASAILNGVGEASRQQLYTLSPEVGAGGRLYSSLTDLELAPSHPIDAGMFRFCHSCRKCAEHCPSESISKDSEPTWDRPQFMGKDNVWTVRGTKAFITNGPQCNQYVGESGQSCNICWGQCTFTVNQASMIHQVVKQTIATTGIFNSLFYKGAENFGYGQKDPETWFDLNLPSYGADTTVVSTDGGYRK